MFTNDLNKGRLPYPLCCIGNRIIALLINAGFIVLATILTGLWRNKCKLE